MRRIQFIIFVLGLFSGLKAQENPQTVPEKKKLEISILSKKSSEGIKLRWAVSDPYVWEYSNIHGYQLVKYTLDTLHGKLDSMTVRILPWTLKEWLDKSDHEDMLSAMSAQILYGKAKDEPKGITLDAGVYQENVLTNKHAYALLFADRSFHVARGLGMGYLDVAPKPGQIVSYEISATLPKDTTRVVKAICSVSEGETREFPMPVLQATSKDSAVEVKWYDVSRHYSGFYFEVAQGETGAFKRISKNPFYPNADPYNFKHEYTYTIPSTNYHKIRVRMQGFDAFGDLTAYSNEVESMGVDLTPPTPPYIHHLADRPNGTVEIKWKLKPEEPIKGFVVSRASEYDGPFIPLVKDYLPPSTRSFVDTTVQIYDKNFYVVSVFDTAGNRSNSTPSYVVIHDETPPAMPKHFSAKIDTQGVVRFKWDLGKEPDLKGYAIYFANSDRDQYQPIIPGLIQDTTFTDTIPLDNLTEHIYYKLAAFDRHTNQSPLTPALEAKKPDILPPVSPQILRYEVQDSAVLLVFVPSSSHDAIKTEVQRRSTGQTGWTHQVDLDISDTLYTDRSITGKTRYSYRLIAWDDDGLKSPVSSTITIRTLPSKHKVLDLKVKASFDEKEQGILLDFFKIKNPKKYTVSIYRGLDADHLKLYKVIPATESRYIDKRIRPGISYSYQVLLKDLTHRLVAKSKIITISYKK